jgi:hypothetical protein
MVTSAPGRQIKLRPIISGCRVRTKMPTRQSGKPARTRLSHRCDTIWADPEVERAPSISQSLRLCNSTAFIRSTFAAQVAGRSRRSSRRNYDSIAKLPKTVFVTAVVAMSFLVRSGFSPHSPTTSWLGCTNRAWLTNAQDSANVKGWHCR